MKTFISKDFKNVLLDNWREYSQKDKVTELSVSLRLLKDLNTLGVY